MELPFECYFRTIWSSLKLTMNISQYARIIYWLLYVKMNSERSLDRYIHTVTHCSKTFG